MQEAKRAHGVGLWCFVSTDNGVQLTDMRNTEGVATANVDVDVDIGVDACLVAS